MKVSLEIANKWTFLGSLAIFLIAIGIFVFAATPNPHHDPTEVYPQGSGSSLDADLLDGYEASELLAAAGTGDLVAFVCGSSLSAMSCFDVPGVSKAVAVGAEGAVSLAVKNATAALVFYADTTGTGGLGIMSGCAAGWKVCDVDVNYILATCDSSCPLGWTGEAVPTGGLAAIGSTGQIHKFDSSTGALEVLGPDDGTLDTVASSCTSGWYFCHKT